MLIKFAFQRFLFIIFFSLSAYVMIDVPCVYADKYGGQIVLATTSDPKSFNAVMAKETSTTEITGLIFEGLTTTNPFSYQVEPNLAKRWDVSADGLTWTFYLREDVLWSDGNPFTADDVVFTYNDLIFNPDIPASSRDIFMINGESFKVEKIDIFTVRFVLPVKFAPFTRGLSQEILPKHKLETVVENGQFNSTWGINTDPKEIVGTGPFQLLKYEPGERIVFGRNPHYWKRSQEGDRLPYVDKIIYLIVQNADVQLLKFMEGTIDAYSLRGMDYPLLKPLESERNFVVYDLGPDTGSQFILFNQNTSMNPETGKTYIAEHKLKWFTNLDFRRATAHSIDKDKIIQIVKNGLGYLQDSSMGPGTGFFNNPNVATYDFDLRKAGEILGKAGFKDRNGDGYLEDPDGYRLEFNLYTNAGATERVDIASIIRHDLESLGMKINFQALEFNTLVSKLTSSYEFDAVVLGLTGGIEPHFGKNVWHSSGQLHMWYPLQKKPATAWERRIDQIFDQGVQELDENKRKVLYDEFQMIVSEQLPLVYTVLSAKLSALRNKFGNIKPSSLNGVFHNIEEIYVKEDYQ
jgi:peptide/nickel transport system substrate-binding protein